MTIHDHFDGSAHCAECGGPCTLSEGDQKITTLVRYVLESYSFRNMLVTSALKDLLGTRLPEFDRRARKARNAG